MEFTALVWMRSLIACCLVTMGLCFAMARWVALSCLLAFTFAYATFFLGTLSHIHGKYGWLQNAAGASNPAQNRKLDWVLICSSQHLCNTIEFP